MSVLAACALPDGEYAAVAECGAQGRHDPLCAIHGIVMTAWPEGELRSSLSLTRDWKPLNVHYRTPSDASVLADLLREAREGVPHVCRNTQSSKEAGQAK